METIGWNPHPSQDYSNHPASNHVHHPESTWTIMLSSSSTTWNWNYKHRSWQFSFTITIILIFINVIITSSLIFCSRVGDVDRNRVLVVGAGPCGLRYDYHHINRQKVTIFVDEVPILHEKRLTEIVQDCDRGSPSWSKDSCNRETSQVHKVSQREINI